MAKKYLMNWEGSLKRWRKQYKKQTYIVYCRQLKAPENKEGSYQAANVWWLRTKAEVDAASVPPHPHQPQLDNLVRRTTWARRHAPDEVPDLERQRAEIESRDGDDTPDALSRVALENIRLAELFGIAVPDSRTR